MPTGEDETWRSSDQLDRSVLGAEAKVTIDVIVYENGRFGGVVVFLFSPGDAASPSCIKSPPPPYPVPPSGF